MKKTRLIKPTMMSKRNEQTLEQYRKELEKKYTKAHWIKVMIGAVCGATIAIFLHLING